MAKKVSKFFRIGVEGDTVDGREIGATDIQQMAASYSPKVLRRTNQSWNTSRGFCRMAISAVTAVWLS